MIHWENVALVLVSFTIGVQVSYAWAARRWWRKGFADHREIVEQVWGADPRGWVEYTRRVSQQASATEEKPK